MDDSDHANHAPIETLMKAWAGIRALPPTNPNSFFVMGGFHGEPFRGAETTDRVTAWGGWRRRPSRCRRACTRWRRGLHL